MMERLMNVKEVADALGIDRQQVYAMLRSGALPGVDVGTGLHRRRSWRVRPSDLKQWQKSREVAK